MADKKKNEDAKKTTSEVLADIRATRKTQKGRKSIAETPVALEVLNVAPGSKPPKDTLEKVVAKGAGTAVATPKIPRS